MNPSPAEIREASGTMPAIYLGHGAPPLLEDKEWMGELGGWATSLPRPTSILIVGLMALAAWAADRCVTRRCPPG